MKNLQTFSEFVNESESINEAYYTLADIMKDAPEQYNDEKDVIWDPIMKAMKIKNPKDLGSISSEDEGTPEYDLFFAIKDKFKSSSPVPDLDSGGWGNYYYDKKLNVVHHEEQGMDAYFFNIKDAKKLLK